MPNDEQIPTFPVAGYSLRSVPALEALILQFDYLSSPMQELEQAHQGRNYILTRVQTVELRDALTRALEKLEHAHIPAEMKN